MPELPADQPPELLVRQVLGSASATILDWRAEPIAYAAYLPGRSLVRFTGRAWIHGREAPWSLVRKVTSSGQREARAYRELLGELRGELTAPRAVVGADDGETTTLWLEEVADARDHRWTLADYATAASALGSFNGAYLAPCALPACPWLTSDWVANHSEPDKIDGAVAELRALADDPLVRRLGPVAAHAQQLLDDQPRWATLLAQLPATLCHHDASQANLFLRAHPDRGLETVAIDWEAVGYGVLGADLASLVVGTIRRGRFAAARAAELGQAAFEAYVDGLQRSSPGGDRSSARVGYAAAVALRWSIVVATLRAIAEARAVPQMIALSRFVLDHAALARSLPPRGR